MADSATSQDTIAPAPRPSAGALAWLILMVGAWVVLGLLALTSQGTLSDIWHWVTGLPLVLEVVVWVLSLPWTLALAVWESSWDDSLRIIVVALIAAGWTLASIPRAGRGGPDQLRPGG